MKTIITHPNFDYLWQELVERNPEILQLWKVEFKRFPDNITPNQFFHDVKNVIEHKDVTYIWDFSVAGDIFDQYNILFNIVKNTANKLRIIMPFFPVGTSERVEKKWEIEAAHAYAYLFSSLPSGRREKNSIHIFDIHALVEQSLFDISRINAELHTATTLVQIKEDECVVFPDEWAAKRFKYAFPEVAQERRIICDKVRLGGEKRKVTIKEWDPSRKNCIIVDDLIQTGGTIKEAAETLRKAGAISVRAFAPHGVFPFESYKSIANELDSLIVTDSIPVNRERKKGVQNMEVFSILPLIEKILLERQ